MKKPSIVLILASGVLCSACSYIPYNSGPVRNENADYSAIGSIDAHAYLYGNRTVLELDDDPTFLTIKDDKNRDIDYEVEGRFYRLNRQADNFTVWADGQSITFTANQISRVFSSPVTTPELAPQTAFTQTVPVETKLSAIDLSASTVADYDLASLIMLSRKQLAADRKTINAAASNHKMMNGADLFALETHLDNMTAKPAVTNTAVIQVSFHKASTVFRPSDEIHFVLLNAAIRADSIAVTGFTDSRIAGPTDARIAQGRATAAKKFLTNNGVNPEKITVSSVAQGEFVAPYFTKKGAALNRRVEIAITHSEIAKLNNQVAKSNEQQH